MTAHGRVLIADDDPGVVRALSMRCSKLGLEVETASNGLQAILKATRNPPNALILDLNMPEADGFRVCEWLLDPRRPPMEVIILTGRSDDDTLLRCEAFGAYYVAKAPDAWHSIKPLLEEIFQFEEDPTPAEIQRSAQSFCDSTSKVLVVDDDSDLLRALEARLKKCGVEVCKATNGMEGFRLALREKPDVVIADYNMPEGGGHYLIWRLRSTEATSHIPIIIITGEADLSAIKFPLERDVVGRAGAVRMFRKPLQTQALVEELSKHCTLQSKTSAYAAGL
jgi:CheY-like chemotaxis protein